MSDEYGIGRERKIAEAGIRNVFTPNKPVDAIELFFGRTDIVRRVIESLNTPGQHLLLYGDRGVGKSSLANVTAKILNNNNFIEGDFLVKRCSSSDSFSTVSKCLVETYSPDANLKEEVITKKTKENVGAKVEGLV